jgi:hypothetical protein
MLRKSEIVQRHKISLEEIQLHQLWCGRKKSIVDEALLFLPRLEDFLRSIKVLLYEA